MRPRKALHGAAALAFALCLAFAATAAPRARQARQAAPPAPFSGVPAPEKAASAASSAAAGPKEYRVDAARHLYAAYPQRIFRGRMPPLLYSVMAVETEIDASGAVLDVQVVRKPAVDEVAPWVVAMIKGAGPYPPPANVGTSTVRYFEIWLVDKSGRFQVDTLTEGQR